MVLGRIIIFTEGEKKSPVPARWLTKIFVVGDLISFLVQCGGTPSHSTNNLADLKGGFFPTNKKPS